MEVKKPVKKNNSENTKNEFIEMIKTALVEKDISLRELARKSSLDVSFLSKILNGKRNPPSNEKDIKKIGKILDIEPDRLLFSAGRIPSSLQEMFNNKDFIEGLISSSKKDSKSLPLNKKEKTVGRRTYQIEDELL